MWNDPQGCGSCLKSAEFCVASGRVYFSHIANMQHVDICALLVVFLHFCKAVPKPSLDHVLKCL